MYQSVWLRDSFQHQHSNQQEVNLVIRAYTQNCGQQKQVSRMLSVRLFWHCGIVASTLYNCAVAWLKASVEQQSVRCRFHAFATPMIYAIQQLLPHNSSIEGVPGEDFDLYLALEDLEQMQPSHLNSVTCWLEKQVADVSRLAVLPVSLRPLCLDNDVPTKCCLDHNVLP